MYRSVTIEEIAALHREFIGSHAGEVTAVGDFDVESFKALIKEQLDGLEVDQPYVRVDRPAHPEIPGSLEAIETPDKENAVYRASLQVNLSDSDPEFAVPRAWEFLYSVRFAQQQTRKSRETTGRLILWNRKLHPASVQRLMSGLYGCGNHQSG